MIFANPMAFWALLFLIPLILLYFLKVRPAKKVTTTLFLWDQIFEEKKQNGFLKNFRELLSLLLLLMSFLAAILALAEPSFSRNENKQNLVLIIDSSASMNAVDDGTKRIELAKNNAQKIVNNLNSTQQVIIASINSDLAIVTNATSNKRELTKGIESVVASQFPLNLPALQALATNSSGINNSRIIFISDGSAAGVEKLQEVELFKVGEELENIGLTSCDISRSLTSLGTCNLFYQLTSTFPNELEVDLIIANGSQDNIVKVIPTQVKSGVNEPVIFNVPVMDSDKWFISVDKKDALEVDNFAYLLLPKQQPFRLKLFGSDAFLGFCVEAFERSGNLMQAVTENPEVNFCIGSPDKSTTAKVIWAPRGDFEGISSELAANGVTVSTVSLGSGAAVDLMARIAEIGNGRAYVTSNAEEMPRIFTKETIEASKSAIKEEPFVPVVISSASTISGINMQDAPYLLGYVMTKPRLGADMQLLTESGDPLLAFGAYGLGRTAAFTSDITEQWSSEWLEWSEYGTFWAHITRSITRNSNNTNLVVETKNMAETKLVNLTCYDIAGELENDIKWDTMLIDESGQTKKLAVQQNGLGRYSLRYTPPVNQSYAVRINDLTNNRIQTLFNVRRYSEEYVLSATADPLVATINKWQPELKQNEMNRQIYKNIWQIFVLLALIFTLVGIFFRRI